MKHAGLIALGVGVGAVVVYELFFADEHIPAGYSGQNLAPGVDMTIPSAQAATGDVAGQFGFILPRGAKWIAAARTPGPGSVQIAVPVPASTSPLLLTGLGPGSAVLLKWADPSGATQYSGYAFV